MSDVIPSPPAALPPTPRAPAPSAAARAAVGIAVGVLAVAITVALAPLLAQSIFVVALAAVAVAAWYGGAWPGFLAGVVCVLGVDHFVLERAGALHPVDPAGYVPVAAYVAVAALVGTLTARLRAARDVAALAAAERAAALAALEEANARQAEVNARLQAHALEAELANQQLHEQAAELEHHAEALEAAAARLKAESAAADAARRAAEVERARLDRVVAQFPAAVAVLEGPELRFRAVSAAYRQVIGGRDVVGRPIREALPELSGGEGGPDFFALLDGVFRTGEPVTGSSVVARWDGDGDGVAEEHLVDLVYAPRRVAPDGAADGAWGAAGDGAGEPAAVEGVTALVLDVSARVRAEAALRESEARFRAVADAAPVMLWVTEADGRCTFLNRAWLEFTGETLEAGLGFGWLDAVHPDDAPAAERAFRDASARGVPFRADYRLRRADGEYRWTIDAAAPRLGAAGEFLGFVGSVVDIEERARLLDAERTARRAAEAANEAKGQFLATMSHELRTPLNAIGGYAELLELGIHGPVTDEQRGALDRIRRAQQHLLGLITDVLNYAKLESGRVEYDVRPVALADVVRDVLPFVEPQLAAKGLAFDVRLPPDPATGAPVAAWADGEKLGQVLLNLLSNAVKFTPAGGRVAVELVGPSDGAGPADVVYLRVRDTGIGIARDKLEAVFEPFVQVSARYAGERTGTGLGLSISRDLARGMGGDLRARSAPGAGSTFTVTLRRAAAAAGGPAGAADDGAPHDGAGPDGAGPDGAGPDGELVGIPPALDRALARAVLGAVDAAGAAGVAAAVLRVTDALAEQGAPGGAVLLALEDAFAALLAGQRHPAERERVHALAERAKTLAASRLRGADVGA